MLALDTPHADKLPPLDASIEGDRDASYDTTEYQVEHNWFWSIQKSFYIKFFPITCSKLEETL